MRFVPNILTVGFITAENPMVEEGIPLPLKEKMGNEQLESILRSGSYGYNIIKGKYDHLKNPFHISNIQKRGLMYYANMFDQRSFIFGYRTQDEIIFELMETSETEKWGNRQREYNIAGMKRIFVTTGKSEVTGREFIIPFSDESGYEGTVWMNGRVVKEREIPATPKAKRIIDDIDRRLKRIIEDNIVGYTLYSMRGMIANDVHTLVNNIE